MSEFELDGWLCNDDPSPFGHTVCREVRKPGDGFPVALVLTCDDSAGPFEVPESVQRWLLRGER